jgi:WD40 repeat protein
MCYAIRSRWMHLWKRRVQVLLVFLRWYAHHRKRGKVLAHEHALVIAEYVPALETFVTVDVTGVMRYWRPDQDESAVIDSWVAEYHLLNACSSSEGTSDDLLTAAIVDSSSEAPKVKLFSAQQSGSMSVHTMVGDEVHSTRLPSVPCEPTFLHYSAEHAPYSLLVRSRNGQAYLCDLSAIEVVKKLECPRKERVHDFATAACCATMSSIASTVLLSFQYLDAAGESVIHGFDRTSGRFNSALRSLRTPSQPDPHSTGARNYAYNPAIRQLLFIPSEKKLAASTASARYSATSAARTKQRGAGPGKQHNGLLVVVREDGCCHLVDVEYLQCVQQFAANVGPGCVVGGWDSDTGMLIAGDYDGFVKLLRIDHHRGAARGGDDQPWSAQSPAPPATGSSHLSVAHAWRAHVSAVTSVAAAPPRRFISGGADGSVMLWSANGEPLRGLGVTRAELWVLHWFRMDEPLRPVEPFREPPVGEMRLARRKFRTAIETISTTYKQQSARRMQRATVIHHGSIGT